MIQGLSSAKSGLVGQQQRVDTIANNIANINTTGFRTSSARFADTLYTSMQNPEEPGGNLQLGTGLAMSSTTRSFVQGPSIWTGNALDLSITGEGFFVVEKDGQPQYTRNGTFATSTQGENEYLVTEQGYYVLDENMQRIQIPQPNQGKLSVTTAGDMTLGEDAQPFARLAVASFSNQEGLSAVGESFFVPTEASGPAMATGGQVTQGALEGSNTERT